MSDTPAGAPEPDAPARAPGTVYTFYSYKGGVGRSMAMAGVAYLLARRGLKVLAIDFDLEAPGLERYFFESEPAARVREHPGLMDLIQTYKLALTSEAEFEAARFKTWWNFVYEAIPSLPGGGRVDLMTAGRREPPAALRDYAEEFLREAQDPRRMFVKTFDFLCTLPQGEAHVAVIVSPGRQQGQYYVAIARRLVMPR